MTPEDHARAEALADALKDMQAGEVDQAPDIAGVESHESPLHRPDEGRVARVVP